MKRDSLYIFKKNILLSFALLMLYTGLMAQYCTPTTSSGSTYYITNFTITSDLGNLNNSSGNSPTGYTDFSAVPALSVTLGSLVPLQYSINASSGTYGYAIWIDYNQNGQFDASEQVLSTNSYTSPPMTGNFILSNMAMPGPTRMRIIAAWTPSNPSNPCVNSGSGEYEDYMINIISPSPCSGTPTPGNTLSSANPVCPNTNFNLTLQNPPVESGLTFQWESADDAAFTVNLQTLGTNPSQTTSQMTAKYYRCLVTCTNSGLSAYSTPVQVTMTPIFNCYCASYATSTLDEYIDTVRVGSFVNQSSGICSGYQNFTSSVPAPTFFLGQTYPSAIGTRDCEGSSFYTRYVEVYIDLNQDGVYSEPSEMVLGGQAVAANQSSVLGNITIPLTAQTGLTGMRVVCRESGNASSVTPCGTYSWGETEDYKVLLAPLPANDAGIASLISPSNPSASGGCQLDDTVKVSITTIGTTNLTSADVHVVVNSILVSTYNWTGNLSSNQTMDVAVGLVSLNDGDTVTVWVTNPNGVSDGFAFNDTARIIVHNALNGIYTVYGTTPDFATLNDAIDALTQRGACADITFNVRPGSYTEQVVIGTFPGAGNHTVTIQSETQNASDVRFEYNAFSSAFNYVVAFDGTNLIKLNKLTLQNMGAFSTVISFKNNSKNISIENCLIWGDTSVTAINADKHTINSVDGNDDNLSIFNNDIHGGSRAIWLFGQNNSTPESGLDIYKNTITQYYQAGIVLVNQKRPKVRGNFVYVTPSNPIGNIFHIDIEDILDGAVVTGNRVGGVQGGFGINIVNVDANPSNPSLVANNMVYMGSTINPTYSEGIALQDVSNIRVVFNTVYTSSTTPETGALRLFMGASNGIELYNNNVVNAGAGLAINAESPYYISASDHNNLYAPSGNIGKLGTNTYNTLANWQSGSGFDNASLSVDPNFAGYDLHTCRAELDGAGIPIASITNDFDGDSRDVNHPDIGADEFISVSDFSLGPDIVKCPNDTVILSAPLMAGTTYNWSPFFQNTPSIEATVPATYFVQVVSSCGLAIDTVIVSDFPNPTASFTSTTSFFTAIFTNNSSNGSSYLWDFGDGHTSTDVNPTHVYDNEGSFTVTLTVTNDCGSTSTTAQTVVISVPHNSIEDENAQKLSVYPNPTDAISRISFEFTGSEMVYLSVIDLSGKTIWMHNMGIYQGSFSTNINFSTYSAGTYLVRVTAGNYTALTRIVVK